MMANSANAAGDWERSIESAMDEDDWARALRLAREVCRRLPDDPENYIRLGRLLAELGNHEEAVGQFAYAAGIAPDSAYCSAEYAWALYESGNFEKSAKEACRAISLDESEALAHKTLAWLFDRRGMMKEALEEDEIACSIDPEFFPLPPQLGDDECRQVVLDTIADMPEEFRKIFDTVPIVVEPHPKADWMRESHLPATLLGMYDGPSMQDISIDSPPSVPPAIRIFTRCIARSCSTADEAKAELHTTILHELAHHLSFEEEDMPGLGLE